MVNVTELEVRKMHHQGAIGQVDRFGWMRSERSAPGTAAVAGLAGPRLGPEAARLDRVRGDLGQTAKRCCSVVTPAAVTSPPHFD